MVALVRWPVVLIGPFLWLVYGCHARPPIQRSQPGVISIAAALERGELANVAGQWRMLAHRLVDPLVFSKEYNAERNGFQAFPERIQFPLATGGKSPFGFATLQIVLKIPAAAAGQSLGIIMPPISSAYRLYIGRELRIESGIPAVAKNESISVLSTQIVENIPYAPEVILTLQVANFLSIHGGATGDILLGANSAIRDYADLTLVEDFLIIGGLLFLGAYFCLIYFARNEDRSAGMLAVFYAAIAARILSTDHLFIRYIWPGISAEGIVRFAYATPSLALIALIFFYRGLFPQMIPGWLTVLTVSVLSAFIGVFSISSPVFFSEYFVEYIIALAMSVLIVTAQVVLAVRHKAQNSVLMFLAGLPVLAGFVHDILTATQLIHGHMWIQYGIVLYAVAIGIIYARRVAASIWQANQTSAHLEKLVEIKTEQYRQADAEREIAFRNMLKAKIEAESANQAKTSFMANMSHEIRTPLNAIVGMSELLLDAHLAPEHKERLKVIRVSAETQLALINEILDFSKLQARKLEIDIHFCDLPEFLHDTFEMARPLAEKKRIGLLSEISPDLPRYVLCDTIRLRQVLLNLMGNAIKFTNSGFAALRVDATIITSTYADISFNCIDTGIGVSAVEKEKLFRPFVQADSSITRRYGGTGLGLSISKEIVELMGGNLDVESEQNFGARFHFTICLPIAHRDVLAIKVENLENYAVKADRLKMLRVLLVEDNEINREIVTEMLGKLGVRVESANDGQIAVEMASLQQYDLIFMDIQMPEMDGLSATQVIRSRGIATTIIALTANTSDADRSDCLNAGMNDFLSKPVTMKSLSELLIRYV